MISEPSRRISACRRPTALCSRSSERNEFEHTSSASAAVLWAAVRRSGRISWSTTGTPRVAICQAASDPASPPPMMCTACKRSSVMGHVYDCHAWATMYSFPRPLCRRRVSAHPDRKSGACLGAGGTRRRSGPKDNVASSQNESARTGRARSSEFRGNSAVGAFPRDPRNVRSGDADIGQFAVAELIELVQACIVAPPRPEEVDECDKHGLCLSRPLLAVLCRQDAGNPSQSEGKVSCCVAADVMLRRSYAKNA